MTLRELVAMAEGRERSEWSRMSALLAMLANAHRDPKKGRPYTPRDFDPFEQKNAPVDDVKMLKALFLGKEIVING